MKCIRCCFDRPQWEFYVRYVTNSAVVRSSHCYECRAQMSARWRFNNPEKQAAARKSWNQRHPEMCRAARKRNKIAQPATLRLRRKRYRNKHRLRETIRARRWYKQHPETRKHQKKRWKTRCVQDLRPAYLKVLLAQKHKKQKSWTASELESQKLKTLLWRTKPLFKTMAAATILTKA